MDQLVELELDLGRPGGSLHCLVSLWETIHGPTGRPEGHTGQSWEVEEGFSFLSKLPSSWNYPGNRTLKRGSCMETRPARGCLET